MGRRIDQLSCSWDGEAGAPAQGQTSIHFTRIRGIASRSRWTGQGESKPSRHRVREGAVRAARRQQSVSQVEGRAGEKEKDPVRVSCGVLRKI